MKIELDRSLCPHHDSMRCDRCSQKVINFEKEGTCVVEFNDNNPEILVLTVQTPDGPQVYDVPVHALLETENEGLEALLVNIAQYLRPIT